MATNLKALAALLMYPENDLIEALPDLRSMIEGDAVLAARQKSALVELISELAEQDLLSLQETYDDIFDRGRATSLHLFEHVHGESRDRGMAMVDLRDVYERAGFSLKAGQLPDYLPAMLEFLSLCPEAQAQEMLTDCAHILRKIGDALAERDSSYSAVPAALLALYGQPGLTPPGERRPVKEEKSLDEEWAEEPVVFGPGAAPACAGQNDVNAVIRFMPRVQSNAQMDER